MQLSDTQHRRTVLLGSIGGLAMVAGCLDSDDGSDESPADTDDDGPGDDDSTDGTTATDDAETEDDDAEGEAILYFGETSASWPRELTDHANSGYLSGATDQLTSFERTLDIESAVDTTLPRFVFRDEMIYSVFGDGTIRAYTIDGEEQWDRSSDVAFGPFLDSDGLFVVTNDDQLVRIDADSGDQDWIRPAPNDWEYVDALVTDGRLYGLIGQGVSEYVVGEYDIGSEEVTWESDHVDQEPQEMLLADETIVVRETGSFYAGVRAIDIGDETARWETELEAQSMLVGGNTLFGLDLDGSVDPDPEIHALSMADGTQRWSEPGAQALDPETTITDGERLFCATDEGYSAFDGETGDEEWTIQLENEVRPGPFVTEGTLYLAEDARVSALDPIDGSELGTETISDVSEVTTVTGYRDRLWVGGESRAMGRDLIALGQSD